MRITLGISDEEAMKLRRWPTLGEMISEKPKDRMVDDDRRAYLSYLYDTYYKDFSSDTHLSPPGFYRRAPLLLKESRLWTDTEGTVLAILRTKSLVTSIGLMLAMSAEIEHELQFGMAERLERIWTRFNHYSPELGSEKEGQASAC